jgi:serine/threonine protein kinase
MTVERTVDIALQLLEALHAIHREGVIHRDVKPSNVQLNGTRRVVLTDFGVASSVDRAPADEPDQVFSSPPYTAPEAVFARNWGPAADMFSLGATLYAAVEGHQPFSDLTPFSTLVAVMRDAPEPTLHSDGLRPVIDGLLTKDPDERMGLQEVYVRLKGVESDLASGRDPLAEDVRRPGADRPASAEPARTCA